MLRRLWRISCRHLPASGSPSRPRSSSPTSARWTKASSSPGLFKGPVVLHIMDTSDRAGVSAAGSRGPHRTYERRASGGLAPPRSRHPGVAVAVGAVARVSHGSRVPALRGWRQLELLVRFYEMLDAVFYRAGTASRSCRPSTAPRPRPRAHPVQRSMCLGGPDCGGLASGRRQAPVVGAIDPRAEALPVTRTPGEPLDAGRSQSQSV